eukprot:CAMPEP_0202891334 /NCGR_PEP_ID=MMETSP1392-20130828/1417_1 /ASSEMBLY_ACC=CAM_ASM_000868 /TAXON_ID=225041 /ORGANISM="Chlamydomonas chlamydogama, Strain SAG 11-48b" /LENGTH=645 /DNA_ID=CAMNT_0049575047 /DNA_START=129 /DNA_END=2066 /DNA_ORIENTATION=+
MAVPTQINQLPICELCADSVDAETEYTCELTCSSRICGRNIYHQDCLEVYIRRQGLPPDRPAGFMCPRGHGKGATGPECKGRIGTTHKGVPCTNKKKKKLAGLQASDQPAKPIIKPAPAKPPQPAPKAVAAAAAARLLQKVAAAPTSAKPPPKVLVKAPGPDPKVQAANTKAQMQALVANLRQEIAQGGSKQQQQQQLVKAVPGSAKPTGAQAAAPLPGAGAAARLGTARAGQAPAPVPGLELEESPRQQQWGGRTVKPSGRAQQQQQQHEAFDLQDETEAFPSLGAAPGAPRQRKAHQAPVREANAMPVNAMDPAHKNKFISDLDAYNELLKKHGLMDDCDDEFGDEADRASSSNGGAAGGTEGLSSQHSGSVAANGGAEEPDICDIDITTLDDEILLYAIEHGCEAVGLPASFEATLQQIKDMIRTGSWQQEVEAGADGYDGQHQELHDVPAAHQSLPSPQATPAVQPAPVVPAAAPPPLLQPSIVAAPPQQPTPVPAAPLAVAPVVAAPGVPPMYIPAVQPAKASVLTLVNPGAVFQPHAAAVRPTVQPNGFAMPGTLFPQVTPLNMFAATPMTGFAQPLVAQLPPAAAAVLGGPAAAPALVPQKAATGAGAGSAVTTKGVQSAAGHEEDVDVDDLMALCLA